jgi:hypothetical protein
LRVFLLYKLTITIDYKRTFVYIGSVDINRSILIYSQKEGLFVLKQAEVDALLGLIKTLLAAGPLAFPEPGKYITLDAVSVAGHEKFLIDVNRKGVLKITKCTYQTRYMQTHILLRLDLDGPDHPNPDGTIVPCPHIHIYREGYGTSWAFSLPEHITSDSKDLVRVLIDFLRYNNIFSIPPIHYEGGLI